MRWQDRRESNNVEDRRQQGSGGGIPIGGKGRLILLVVVMVAGYYGVDLSPLLSEPTTQSQPQRQEMSQPAKDPLARFTSVMLASTEDAWGEIFQQSGSRYQAPKLVLYRGATRTGCGQGQSVMGPFYCPADRTVYIDLSFYQEMRDKLGADGDFAQGYVVAHEVGHHVQNLLGIERKIREQQQGLSRAEQNKLSVKLELQADCFAGVWGHYMQQEQVLEHGDLEEALNAAQAIGDDRLQQQSQGRVIPDSFTHGSSAQRYAWFKRGFDSGKPASCNTFAAR
ncbi:KPN_02809 family neutral zinc metallopeptidase [Aeromonas hydrophila]|uniref:Zinc protease n=1 Tax=Aeromonas hydrophila subsp. hydrophila (strain ATCC 7966 / DSM 30187 / BCRC 13018 / CCUG 14551 / JCM 1027 / KCTC 2358 / NCIMB 9240 / NCTC 8049) TaxID=380703 RepID=A0KFD3_AERHH|nr:neutral zinc metallopeptidase [Aeromonas hydrophila]ABK38453.1 zinc protease [Aeromonas hydrophila subsp. hydrophila ATCC 7966]MBS4673582.1 zinc metallopeptidase [Aeromonas hydrophila]OOD34584.1 zinc protease [Aeromonas hydrophila]SUU14860.1 zinc protease [Aeromonas hydrophila]